MATGRVPTTANSPLTAKGDLFGYSTAPARLAVGNDGEQIVADSSTSTGLRYQGTMAAGKNAIINGGFDVWQRGTSAATAGGSYVSADRWWVYTASGSATFGQETTVIPAGSQYASKITSTGAGTSIFVAQAIETLNSTAYAGKTVAFTGQVAASTSVPLTVQLQYSTTVDNAVNGTWTTITPTSGGTVTPTTTTYVSFTAIYAIPSTAKSLRAGIYHTGTVANGVITYLGQMQLEVGSVGTLFTRAGGTIQGELAACQRYYYRKNSVSAYQTMGTGLAVSTTLSRLLIYFPVSMRINPTAIESSAASNFFLADGVTNTFTTSFSFGVATTESASFDSAVSSGLTQYRPYGLTSNNNGTFYVAFSAEL
jgi:hypothetical protein